MVSTKAAGIGLYLFVADDEPGAEVAMWQFQLRDLRPDVFTAGWVYALTAQEDRP